MTSTGLDVESPKVEPRRQTALAVAAAVDAVPGIRRSGGFGVMVSTQFRGGQVEGVKLGDDEVLVQVVAESLPLGPLIAAIRDAAQRALLAAGDKRPVAVTVVDLDIDRLPSSRLP